MYFVVFSVVIGCSVQKIWTKLKSNPGLRRNERIYWQILFVIATYGILFLASALSDYFWNNLTIQYAIASCRGVCVTLSNIILLLICSGFINNELYRENHSAPISNSEKTGSSSHNSALEESISTEYPYDYDYDNQNRTSEEQNQAKNDFLWRSFILRHQPRFSDEEIE